MTKFQQATNVVADDGSVTQKTNEFELKVDSKLPKTGLMLVGWGGNNGTTLTAALAANRRKLSWQTREGVQKANWLGSVLFSSTANVGVDTKGNNVYRRLHDLAPMLDPDNLVIGGWDICK